MKKCKWCQKEIISTNKKKVFCDDTCKNNFGNNKRKEIRKNETHYCLVCGSVIKNYTPNKKFCCVECNEKNTIEKHNKQFENKEHCTCEICGWKAKVLVQHLNDKHGITLDTYMTQHNKTLDDCILKTSRELWGSKIKGENNGAYKHDGKFSPYSKKFIKYENMSSDEKDNKINDMYEKLSEKLTDGTGRLPTQVEYWTKQGFTEEEAIEKISERQSTFSLEKCVEKYGEIEGKLKWKERQNKWLNSLYDKPDDEIERIQRSKFKNTGFSKISQELFWSIWDKINDGFENIYFAEYGPKETKNMYDNHEYCIILPNRNVFFLDFFIKDVNKCIEFDGDYWHGEKRGNKERDKIRTKLIEDTGIKVLHIKERDYNNDPQKVIQECIKWIKNS